MTKGYFKGVRGMTPRGAVAKCRWRERAYGEAKTALMGKRWFDECSSCHIEACPDRVTRFDEHALEVRPLAISGSLYLRERCGLCGGKVKVMADDKCQCVECHAVYKGLLDGAPQPCCLQRVT